MTDKQTDEPGFTNWLFRRAPATVFGVLVLGLLCTMLYDLAVKPGLSATGRFFLDLLTLGSQQLRDAAYASAAIDPTPVTPLILLITWREARRRLDRRHDLRADG